MDVLGVLLEMLHCPVSHGCTTTVLWGKSVLPLCHWHFYTTFFSMVDSKNKSSTQTPSSGECWALLTQSWDLTHPVKHLAARRHGILTAKSSGGSSLGAHSASTDCSRLERLSLPRLGWSCALPLPAEPLLSEHQDLLGLGAGSYRCWAPYGTHRGASSHTPPPQKSALLKFYFSKKNTAGIID